jgi:hypothetical protein
MLAGLIAAVTPNGLHVVRFNADGTLDPTFGSAGGGFVVSTDFGGTSDESYNVLVLPTARSSCPGDTIRSAR